MKKLYNILTALGGFNSALEIRLNKKGNVKKEDLKRIVKHISKSLEDFENEVHRIEKSNFQRIQTSFSQPNTEGATE